MIYLYISQLIYIYWSIITNSLYILCLNKIIDLNIVTNKLPEIIQNDIKLTEIKKFCRNTVNCLQYDKIHKIQSCIINKLLYYEAIINCEKRGEFLILERKYLYIYYYIQYESHVFWNFNKLI